ncbi:signal transducer and activator of transcription 6 [Triplophysa dalaica]|uniref:signal transducer and activator of transcription 6 n=1 Tax=Triplophysa dalaica TaxID=1582913 RepID=UPI0024DF3892|nr:signal transducer and activator of transcription 6 [Triplophysa dalaica]
MALWTQMTQQLQHLTTQMLNELYPETFPLDIRHYLASWIEEQGWENFDVDNVEQEPQARMLLEQMMRLLQDVALQNPNVVERVKLQHISRNLCIFQPQPLDLVRTVRDMLRKEKKVLLSRAGMHPNFQHQPMHQGTLASNNTVQLPRDDPKIDVDKLVLKVLEIQNCRQTLYQLQEELNWEKQEAESAPGQNEMDPQNSDKVARQNRIKQLEFNCSICVKKRLQLLQEAVCALEHCQSCLMHRIKSWRWEQHRATIGLHFDDNLGPLQTWCEQLLGVNGNLRQEVMLVKEDHRGDLEFHTLEESLEHLLQTLIQSSLLVDKQPPQVIKTQSKFSTTVRYLLGEKIAPGKPVLLKAQIITEAQARNLGQQGIVPNENVGDLINSTAILEHNTSSKSTCATFRNMSIRKIKRADRKGSESVTEEKFALLFTTELTITGCEKPYTIQTISLPVVVIVHGSQEINAMATVVWDCAFSEPNRIPFVVPERVPWKQMCDALSSKFMSEVQTDRALDRYNLHFLAQKIFDQPDISEDYSNMPVSWAQFNKEVLPGRNFTFWQWFEGVMDLTKKCLKEYWSEGLIFGFIGKQHLHVILQNKPHGIFLLRFSDSEIGGITIAYVGPGDNGGRRIQNIQPFTKKDLDSVGLGDRILDINCITHVYPDLPKQEVFKKFFTAPSTPHPDGYLPFKLTTVVNPGDPSTSSQNMPPQADPSSGIYNMGSPFHNMNPEMFPSHSSRATPPYMPDHTMSVPESIFTSTIQSNPVDMEDMDPMDMILQICQ